MRRLFPREPKLKSGRQFAERQDARSFSRIRPNSHWGFCFLLKKQLVRILDAPLSSGSKLLEGCPPWGLKKVPINGEDHRGEDPGLINEIQHGEIFSLKTDCNLCRLRKRPIKPDFVKI